MLYALAALAGLGMVAAADHQRHAHLHKKQDTAWNSAAPSAANATACGCTTYTTTWYGEATLLPGTSSSTSSSSTSTSTWVAPTTSETPSSTWVAPVSTSSSEAPSSTSAPPPPPPTSSASPETYAAPSSSSWAPAPASSSSSSNNGGLLGAILPSLSLPSWSQPSSAAGGDAGIISDGDKWAMTYTPYTSSGQCKSASDVASDIASIKAKGFTTVRLYATDCSGVENVGAACKSTGLKMIMGIYIDASGLSNGYAQIDELTSWGSSNGWDHVEMVVAGNEAIFNGYVSASDLAGFLGTCKSKFSAAGFTGPVTTTETLNVMQENSATLCPVIDVVGANIHPFFNADVAALDAGTFVSSQLSILAGVCGDSKPAYNLETGWPSAGDANGDAVPSIINQKIAVEAIVSAAGSKSAIFSFENDDWKAPGSLGVEQFWGCASLFS